MVDAGWEIIACQRDQYVLKYVTLQPQLIAMPWRLDVTWVLIKDVGLVTTVCL